MIALGASDVSGLANGSGIGVTLSALRHAVDIALCPVITVRRKPPEGGSQFKLDDCGIRRAAMPASPSGDRP